jgi:RimJ/RimL family protein N-acetyltransferase
VRNRRPAVFETERLVARAWSLDDAEDAWDLYRRPEVVRYIGGKTQDTVEAAREHLRFLIERNAGWPAGYGSFPLFLRDGGRMVGTAIVKRLPDARDRPSEDTEIGWHLHPDVWGRGLATEIGRRLLRHGFETLGLDEIHAVVEPPNTASSAVALRLGMAHVGRTTAYYGGIEVEHYVLRREAWAAREDRP